MSGISTSSNTINPTYSPGAGESGTITFTLTAHGKCSVSVVTNTVAITINSAPSPTISSSNGTSICNGGSTVLTASGAGTYTWNPGAHVGSTYTVSPASTQIYTVAATNTCGTTNATYTVTVNPSPTYSLASNNYIICNGGSQTFTVSGASTYTWTPSATLTNANTANPTANPTTTTVYSVTGTSALGCGNATPATVTVTVSAIPTLSLTANSYTICNGGSQTFTASGASTYTWTPAATLTGAGTPNPTATPATTTIYTVAGTAAGCAPSSPLTLTLTVNPLPTYSLASNSYTICNGGSQTFTVSGASTYTWTPSTTLTNANTANPTASPTTTTVYSVTGTSALGCNNATPATVTVNVTPVPSLSLAANSYSICNGSSQAFAASGASTYTWTPIATLNNANIANPIANPTTTTIYTVSGTATGCATSSPLTLTLTVNPLPIISVVPSSTAICSGGGSSTLTASGASTYTWTNAATLSSSNGSVVTVTPTNTATPTVYTVTGTDANNCVNKNTVSITVNPTPTVSVVGGGGNSQTICGGGLTNATVSGITFTSTPSGSVNWTNNNVGIGISSSGSGNIASYPAPTVTVQTVGIITASSTVAGCTSTASTELNYTITINAIPNETGAIINSAGCGLSDGTITGATGTGGSGNYSYEWNNTGGFVASSSLTDSAGTYPLQIKDNVTGCIYSQNFTIPNAGAPAPPTVTPSATAACVGGTITLTAPTVAGVTYNWTEANGNTGSGNTYTVINIPASPNPYTIDVTATAANCKGAAGTTSITVNPLPNPAISSSTSQICQGSSTTLSVTPTGNYDYQWGNSSGTIAGATSNTLSVTQADTYTVTVTNNTTNCSASTISNGTITVNPLPTYSLVSSSYTICNGDNQIMSVSGASTYTWTHGITLNDSTIAGPTATPTTTTVYSVTGTDANACTNLIPATVTVTVNPLPTYSLSGNVYTICNGGSQTFTVSGASSYTWTPGLTLDNANIASPTASPTTTTVYSVTGTDANACSNLIPATVTVNVTSVPSMSLTADSYTICNGASQTFTASGASTYTWTPASTLDNGNIASPTANPTTTTVYTVNGTASGCAPSPALTLTLTVNPTPTISIAPLGSNSVICNGASVVITPNGATTYTLNPGNQTGTSFTVSPNSSTTYTIDGSFTSTGCLNATVDASLVPITVNPTPTISIAPLGSNSVICNGASVVITPSGATTYTLNPGNQTGTSFTVSPSSSTTYTIDGSDGTTNCTNAASGSNIIPITVNPTPTITINPLGSNSVICNGASVVITPSGATTYTLNPGNQTGTSFTVSPSSTTTYTIDGSDGTNNCANVMANSTLVPITVNQTPTLSVSGASLDSVKCGHATGGVNGISNGNVVGGSSPYMYQWTNISTGAVVSTVSTLSNQGVGTYSLLVTDANGCIANVTGGSSTFTVQASAAIHAQTITNPSPATGSIPLVISFTNTSVGATNYTWSFGDGNLSTATSPTNTYTNGGTYSVVMVAVNGICSDTLRIIVVANVSTTLIIPNVFSPNGDGINDEFFIPNTGIASLTCNIYNRWGQLLRTLAAPNQSWDGITPSGEKAPEGTYMYILEAKGLDGETFKQQGALMLVR